MDPDDPKMLGNPQDHIVVFAVVAKSLFTKRTQNLKNAFAEEPERPGPVHPEDVVPVEFQMRDRV